MTLSIYKIYSKEPIVLNVEKNSDNKYDLTGENLRNADLFKYDMTEVILTGTCLENANMGYTNLTGTNLTGSILVGTNLADSDLTDSDLTGTDLTGAILARTKLNRTKLTGAVMSHVILTGANIADADLSEIKEDFLSQISIFKKDSKEIAGLLKALNEGSFKGNNKHACLAGTIANIQGCDYNDVVGIPSDRCSPTELFLAAINNGDTPKNNPVSEIIVEWII